MAMRVVNGGNQQGVVEKWRRGLLLLGAGLGVVGLAGCVSDPPRRAAPPSGYENPGAPPPSSSGGYRGGSASPPPPSGSYSYSPPPPPPAAPPPPRRVIGPIAVTKAIYGSWGKSCDATSAISYRASGRYDFEIRVTNELCGDPHHGKSKSLDVTYYCGNEQRSASASEHNTLRLYCPRW